MKNKIYLLCARAKHAFSSLQARDQKALAILAITIAIVFLWLGILHPLEAARSKNEVIFHTARSNYQWMLAHANLVKSIQDNSSNRNKSDQPLLSIASDLAKTYEINITHAEPAKDGSLQISAQNVLFSRSLLWLEAMERDYAIKTAQINIERPQAKPGYVNISLILKSK